MHEVARPGVAVHHGEAIQRGRVLHQPRCRLFDEWMNVRYMCSPQLRAHQRTGDVPLAEVEAMHAERDALLDELERLAESMQQMREHIVLDADYSPEDDLADEDDEAFGGGVGGSHQRHDESGALTMCTSVQHEKDSATERACDAVRDEAELAASMKQLEDAKRALTSEISTLEKNARAVVALSERRTKAAQTGLGGMNKELFRLEAAVTAHFRLLRTAYQSLRLEYPAMFEFDAFSVPRGAAAAGASAARSATARHVDAAAAIGHATAPATAAPAAALQLPPPAASPLAEASGASAAPSRFVAPSLFRVNPAAALARDASRLTAKPTMERTHAAAASQRAEREQQKQSLVDRARSEAQTKKEKPPAAERKEASPRAALEERRAVEDKKSVHKEAFKRM